MENAVVKFASIERAMVGNVGQGFETKASGVLGNGDFRAAFNEVMQGRTDCNGILTLNGEKTEVGDVLSKLIEALKEKNGETKADDALIEALASTLMEMFPMAFDTDVTQNSKAQLGTSQIEMITERIAELLTQNEIPTKQFFESLNEMGMSSEKVEQLQNSVADSKNGTSINKSDENQNLFREFCVKLQENAGQTEQKEQSPVSLFNEMRTVTAKVQKLGDKTQSFKAEENNVLAKEAAAFDVVSQGKASIIEPAEPIVVKGIEKEDIAQEIVLNVEKALNDQKKEIIMKLSPESLGEITVKIVKEGGKLSIDLISTMQETAKLLESSQAELKSALKQMGENVTVTTTHANAENNLSQFLNGQRQWQGQQQSRQNNLNYFSGYQQVGTSEDEVISPILNDSSSRLSAMYA